MYSVVCSQRVSNFVQLYRCTGDVIQFVGVVHMLSWIGWWMFLHYRGLGFFVLCSAVLCVGWDIDEEGECVLMCVYV